MNTKWVRVALKQTSGGKSEIERPTPPSDGRFSCRCGTVSLFLRASCRWFSTEAHVITTQVMQEYTACETIATTVLLANAVQDCVECRRNRFGNWAEGVRADWTGSRRATIDRVHSQPTIHPTEIVEPTLKRLLCGRTAGAEPKALAKHPSRTGHSAQGAAPIDGAAVSEDRLNLPPFHVLFFSPSLTSLGSSYRSMDKQ